MGRREMDAGPRGREGREEFESMEAVTQRESARPGFPKRKEFMEKGAEVYARTQLATSLRTFLSIFLRIERVCVIVIVVVEPPS